MRIIAAPLLAALLAGCATLAELGRYSQGEPKYRIQHPDGTSSIIYELPGAEDE